MAKIARTGDYASGTCYLHGSPRGWSGYIESGSSGVEVEGKSAAVEGDIGIADCGHKFYISGGSDIVKMGDKRVARKFDPVTMVLPATGGGLITTGSITTDVP